MGQKSSSEPGHEYRPYIAGKLRFVRGITAFYVLFVTYVVALLVRELLRGGRFGVSLLVRLMTPESPNDAPPESSGIESGVANDVNVEN